DAAYGCAAMASGIAQKCQDARLQNLIVKRRTHGLTFTPLSSVQQRLEQHAICPVVHELSRVRAARLRISICREVGSAIAADFSNWVSGREIVSIVSPR